MLSLSSLQDAMWATEFITDTGGLKGLSLSVQIEPIHISSLCQGFLQVLWSLQGSFWEIQWGESKEGLKDEKHKGSFVKVALVVEKRDNDIEKEVVK